MIEHDGDLEDVRCGANYCNNWKPGWPFSDGHSILPDKPWPRIDDTPPPTTEHHRAPGRYDWSMMIVAVGMASAGFIVGFLVRGGA